MRPRPLQLRGSSAAAAVQCPGAEQAGGAGQGCLLTPEKRPDARARSAGPRPWSSGWALGSAVLMCLALSDSCPILPCRGGCFE